MFPNSDKRGFMSEVNNLPTRKIASKAHRKASERMVNHYGNPARIKNK
jgi:hypothetical protein